MDIPVLYEDEDVVVIDKPSGILVHGDGRTEEPTVADWHAQRVPTAKEVGEPLTLPTGQTLHRPGVVHRLDAETSGVLILAKTDAAFLHLKEQFKERMAQKEYRAFVYGAVREEQGAINRPIGRSAKDFRLRSAQRGARGRLRDATTRWQRIAENGTFSYLALFPETGRTHQLRVHLKALNYPIVGDRLYAPKQVTAQAHALGFERLALHAYRLSIVLPSGERADFTAPLPEDFLHAETLLEA
jgi:23S rRNA pseudouridine1911/1915/1917 synthase